MVDPDYQVQRFRPHAAVPWSRGWHLLSGTHNRANGAGFISPYEYERRGDRPRLAVIGDSYVEALQVEPGQSFPARLQEMLGSRGSIYAFGTSGSPLSNYLIYARMARERYAPEALVFAVIANDFDESMCSYRNSGLGMWCFREGENGGYDFVPLARSSTWWRELGRRSATLRFIAFNLGLDPRVIFQQLLQPQKPDITPEYVANVPAQVSDRRMLAAKTALRLFLDRLPAESGLAPGSILFVIDGLRRDIYTGREEQRDSFFGLIRHEFMDTARARGYEVIDLQRVFHDDYVRHGQRFEHPLDNHCGVIGHYVVAEAMRRSQTFRSLFGTNTRALPRPVSVACSGISANCSGNPNQAITGHP